MNHLSPRRTAYLFLGLGFLVGLTLPVRAADPLTPAERERLSAQCDQLKEKAIAHYRQGRFAEAIATFREEAKLLKQLFPPETHPDGAPEVSSNLNNTGFMLREMGEYDEARKVLSSAVAMDRKLYPIGKYPKGHSQLILSLGNLGTAFHRLDHFEKALPLYEEALAIARRLYPSDQHPKGHANLSITLNNLAMLSKAMGDHERALRLYDESYAIKQRLYPKSEFPDGHPELASIIGNRAVLLSDLGEKTKALSAYEEAIAMERRIYPRSRFPNGHPRLAGRIRDMAAFYYENGALDKALPLIEESVGMFRALFNKEQFPRGHPSLAEALNTLGFIFLDQGQAEKAKAAFGEALEMVRRAFPKETHPNGHFLLASVLNNMGCVLNELDQPAAAKMHFEEAVEMYQRLFPVSKYPLGHRLQPATMSNLARSIEKLGQDDVIPLRRKILEQTRAIYPASRFPDGHEDVARALGGLAHALAMNRSFDEARELLKSANEMDFRLVARQISGLSESDALAKTNASNLKTSGYISVLRGVPNGEAEAYRVIWNSKGMFTRVLERRQTSARAAGTVSEPKLKRLHVIRKRIEQLLLDESMPESERNSLLVELSDESDRLERLLAAELPILARWKERDGLGPADLLAALPKSSAFIDISFYTRSDFELVEVGRTKETLTSSYVAFVAAPNQKIARVELGPADRLHQLISDWRSAIDTSSPSAAKVADAIRRIIWEPLAAKLPTGTTQIFIAPDGEFARLPWAAIPINQDQIVLERFAIATVPHGPFLLEKLKFPSTASGPGKIVAVSDVDYQGSHWRELPGTRAEIAAISPLAPTKPTVLSGREATIEKLTQLLPGVQFAHFATHGEFNSDALAKQRERTMSASDLNWQAGASREVQRVAAKNPLGFVGLVLSKGEVMTGLSLVDLPLEHLKLAILSACESALGETSGGEGVAGLVRAFQLAGAQNVIASLWKVNDAATAALMAKFYHELWVNKKEPLAALREAQLFIYFNPDKIPDVLGERGAPKSKEALAIKGANPQAGSKRADTKLWAAFELSGTGR